MNAVVVGLLIGLWVWVLLPGLLRKRRNSSPGDTVTRVERGMETPAQTGAELSDPGASDRHVLGHDDAHRVVSGRARSQAELRRRALLARGGFTVVVAVIGGFVGEGLWFVPAGVLGVAYLIYVFAVVRLERRLAQQREMLHDLAEERARRLPPEPLPSDTHAVELVVGDESGIIVTGWMEAQSREP